MVAYRKHGSALLFCAYILIHWAIFSYVHVTYIDYTSAVMIELVFLAQAIVLYFVWQRGRNFLLFVATIAVAHLIANIIPFDPLRIEANFQLDKEFVITILMGYLVPAIVLFLAGRVIPVDRQ